MHEGARILIIEDDIEFSEVLVDRLRRLEEYEVDLSHTGSAGVAAAKSGNYAVVVIDVGLPDMDGRDACRVLRKEKIASQIILLTGAATEADQILGLDAGADDYITKPIKFEVFVARLRVRIREYERAFGATLRFSHFYFVPSTRYVFDRASGRKIQLTDRETTVLKVLYRANGKPVSREHLMQSVWGYSSDAQSHTLETHVYRLRQKIESDASAPEVLVTVPYGYRLKLS